MAYYDDIKEKKAPFESHYISAYGLAVKHGFTGSEEEWLESLSDYGIAKKHGFTGSEEEWNEAVNAAREAAEAAQTAAEAAKTAAETAKTAAETAQTAAESARDEAEAAQTVAESARDEAITAQAGAVSAESNAEGAEERINETVTSFNEAYGDFSLQAEKAKEHYDSRSNPHEVTAEQVGAYTKDEVDEKLENVDLSECVKKEEVFETGSFGWTDFDYTANEEAFADIKDNSISAGSSYPITIHCEGKVIGFTASSNGSYYRLKVNGKYVLENTSWNTVSQTYMLSPTLMTEDIVVELSVSQIDFTDMTIQRIKGIGDIDKALDELHNYAQSIVVGDLNAELDNIISIQESYAQSEVVS